MTPTLNYAALMMTRDPRVAQCRYDWLLCKKYSVGDIVFCSSTAWDAYPHQFHIVFRLKILSFLS